MSEAIRCKKCPSENVVKAGKVKGNQRYKCKECGCQFQPNLHKGRSEATKRLAVLLYMVGLSMRTISKIVKTDLHAVYRWIRVFAETHYEKPKPASGKVVVELDEMWHYIGSKKQMLDMPWSLALLAARVCNHRRLIAAIPVNLSTGSVEGETMVHLENFTND